MTQRLSTTSYALLGQLAAKPCSAYELTTRMRSSALRWFWPRTASGLYEEPKKLVAEGLATSREEFQGDRSRTVYEITEQGRRALRAWLDEPPSPLAVEFEAMLKVLFADHGSMHQLRECLARLRENIRTQQAGITAELESELAGSNGRQREPLHLAALASRFAVRLLDVQAEWVDWAEAVIVEWSSTRGEGRIAEHAREVLADSLGEIDQLGDAGRLTSAATERDDPVAALRDSQPRAGSDDWAPWAG